MKKIHYAWWIMIACCAITSCTGFVMTSGGNFFRPVAEELGIGVGTLMLYITIASLTMAALFPTAAKLLGNNLKPVLLAGGLLQYIPFGLLCFATDVMHFYIVGLFIGLGSAVTMFMAVPILMNMWFVEKKGLAMGIAMAFSGVAGIIGSTIVGVTIPVLGWRISYVILACVGLGLYIPSILFLVKTPQEKNMLPYGTEKQQSVKETTVDVQHEKEQKELSPAAAKFAFICMLLSAAALAAASAETTQVSAFSTGHFGFSISMAATMTSCFAFGAMIGKIVLGAIDDRCGHTFTFSLGIVLVIAAQILFLISKAIPALTLATAVLAGAALAVYGVLPPLMTGAIFGQKDYNKYWAYIMSAGCITGAFATPLYGTIFDKTGSYTMVFIVIAVLAAVGGILGLAALKKAKN